VLVATADAIIASFVKHIERFSVNDWKRVDELTPFGHGSLTRLIDSKQWQFPFPWQSMELKELVDQMLEDLKAEGGKKFGSHSYHRLNAALNVIWAREHIDAESFVAGYGPFLPVLPPSAIGIDDEVAELWDPTVRTPIIERYAELLRTLHGRETAADAHLTEDGARISLAICLESLGAQEARRAELEEMYVSLCAFPSVAGSGPGGDVDPVRACENARLKWLGYENARFSEGDRLTIGGGAMHAVAKEDARVQELLVIGGFTPSAVVLIAALVATGGHPGLLGLIAPLLAGAAGSIVGLTAYSVLSRRSKHGSAQRKVAFAIAVALVLGIAAASAYLYVLFSG
jgi:hypothetical protein